MRLDYTHTHGLYFFCSWLLWSFIFTGFRSEILKTNAYVTLFRILVKNNWIFFINLTIMLWLVGLLHTSSTKQIEVWGCNTIKWQIFKEYEYFWKIFVLNIKKYQHKLWKQSWRHIEWNVLAVLLCSATALPHALIVPAIKKTGNWTEFQWQKHWSDRSINTV